MVNSSELQYLLVPSIAALFGGFRTRMEGEYFYLGRREESEKTVFVPLAPLGQVSMAAYSLSQGNFFYVTSRFKYTFPPVSHPSGLRVLKAQVPLAVVTVLPLGGPSPPISVIVASKSSLDCPEFEYSEEFGNNS